MKKDEKWVYRDGKLVGKVTTTNHSDGTKEIVKQRAHSDFLGGRQATSVTSRTRITK